MDHATTLAKHTTGAAEHRLSPLEAFVQWVANLLRIITGMKRRKVFPTNWKDHWQNLRELEWYRDQILAFAVSHVLAGGSLNDRTDFQLIDDIPANYGVCPRTPQAMNHRFIAMAQFRFNSSKYIRRHIKRIAKREGITLQSASSGCPLRLARKHRSLSSSNAQHWGRWRATSSSRDGGGSRWLALNARARAPPTLAHRQPPPPQTLRA